MSEHVNLHPAIDGSNGAAGDDEIDSQRDPLEELAAEFAERLRQNERPSIEDYAARHPDLADEIRDLFPTIAEMERLNRRRQVSATRLTDGKPFPLQQLGDFRVIGEIGRGGMGIVYEAEQVTLGRRVAVKVLPSQALRGPKDIQRFQREARTAARLHHSNIVPVFGVGEQEGAHYIVMQFIQGVGLDEILDELKRIAQVPGAKEEDPSLSDSDRSKYIRHNAAALLTEKLRRDSGSSPSFTTQSDADLSRPSSTGLVRLGGSGRSSAVAALTPPQGVVLHGDQAKSGAGRSTDGGPSSPAENCFGPEYWRNVARIGMQAASGLQYAHTHGTLHRDVKPGNLLLDSDGVVWIADFGLAKAAEQENVTWTGDVVGTLCYLAPERFDEEADARSDVYSLGLTLYEMLTLRRAHQCRDRAALIHQISHHEVTPPRKLNPAIPHDLETIVLKAIARDPADRYQSAGMFAADLQNFLEDRPILARRFSPAERLTRWCRRNRTVAALTAAVAVLLVAVTAVATIGYAREASERQRAEANALKADRNARQAQISELRATENATQAEMTVELANEVLGQIYSQFAPNSLLVSSEPPLDEPDESELMTLQTPLPLSNEVAVLLEKLLVFYDRLSQHAVNNQDVLTKSVMANRRVGDIHYRLGDFEKAATAYQRAIDRHEQMAGASADSVEMRLELARIHNGLGTSQFELRRQSDARASHERALDVLIGHATTPDERYELARTYYLLHCATHRPSWFKRPPRDKPFVVHVRSKESDVDYLQSAIVILNALISESHSSPDYQFLLAQCYLARNRFPSQSEWVRSDDCDKAAADILTGLIAMHPEVPDYRYALGEALFGRANYHCHKCDKPEKLDELRQAETRLLEAVRITRNLDIQCPNIPQYVIFKSMLHQRLANVYDRMGRHEDVIEQLRTAVRKQDQLIRISSDPYAHEVWKAKINQDLVTALARVGRAEEAEELLNDQIGVLKGLADRPADTEAPFCNRAKSELTSAIGRQARWQLYLNTWGRIAQ